MTAADPLFSVVPPVASQHSPGRKRGLPEQSAYPDAGCEQSPSCLECPLARCKYDDPEWRDRRDLDARDARIVELREAGLTVKAIAEAVGVSDRTAYRVLLKEKRAAEKSGLRKRKKPRKMSQEGVEMSLEELEQWRPVTDYAPVDVRIVGIAS